MSIISGKEFFGGKPGTVVQSANSPLTAAMQPQQPSFLSRVGSDIASRAGDVVEQVKAVTEAPQGIATGAELARTPLKIAGAVGGAIGDIVGEGINTLTGGKAAEVLAPLAQNEYVQKAIKQYQDFAAKNPEMASALGDVGNLLNIGAVGAAKSAVTSDVAKAGAKAVTEKVGSVASKQVERASKVTGEIIPTPQRMISHEVAKALDLTQGDIRNLSKSTGNEVGTFLADRNLIAGNKDETLRMIKDFQKENFDAVRTEIGKVTTSFKPNAVPRFRQALQEIQKSVKETPGLEASNKEIQTLLKKKTVTLNDVQRVKELMDEHFSLYKITGDVKESVAKVGLANIRKDLKNFIEKEVKNTTGNDISALNNNVATSKGIADAIETRATSGLTTSNIKIGDLGVFGVGSVFGGPLVGMAAVAGKKILESSAVRLKIAKYMDKISDARKLEMQKELMEGKVPKEIEVIINQSSK